MFNIIHQAWVIKADFVVRKDQPYRKTEFDRRRTVSVEGKNFSVVTAEDLLLSKLHWAKMSDTAPTIEKRYREMLMRLPPEQRLLQSCRMFATAKRLAESSIRSTRTGRIDEETLRRELFLRFYGMEARASQGSVHDFRGLRITIAQLNAPVAAARRACSYSVWKSMRRARPPTNELV